jgi:hypothetical protein
MKIKLEDLKPLRLYGGENEGSTLSLKVGKPVNAGGPPGFPSQVQDGNG